MTILGVIAASLAVLFMLVAYVKNLHTKFFFLCLQYLFFMGAKALLFLVLTIFTPRFRLKTSINSQGYVELIGVNRQSVEIFKYIIVTDIQ